MAFEQQLSAVPPQTFTSDGTSLGVVTIPSTAGFYIKQKVNLQSNTLPQILLQVKNIISNTQLIVGPNNNSLSASPKNTTDISTFTVAQIATISAPEQSNFPIPDKDHYNTVFMPAPVMADRVIGVDPYGNVYDSENPLPVAIDGTISIGDVSIVEGGNTMTVNSDGSINVNIIETPVSGQTVRSIFNQVSAVAAAATVTLVTYTVPMGSTAVLERANASGGNVALYTILVNSVVFDIRRTMFGADLTTDFDYTTGTSNGYVLNSGDVVTIQVTNPRPMAAPFNARLQVLEIV